MTKYDSNIAENLCISLGISESLDQFTDILNKAKDDLFGEYSNKKLSKRSIAYYSDNRIVKHKYKTFNIKKKSGKDRIIHAPYKGLKTIQRCINHLLLNKFNHHHLSFGFVPRKSIIDGAKLHIEKNYVFNIDLQDFFPSINSKRVAAVLQLKPFNFTQKNAVKVANICTTNLEIEIIDEHGNKRIVLEQVLPQGAPTSPVLTNIICQRLDRKMTGLAKRFGLNYSRYADDITFSSNHYVYSNKGNFKKELKRIIENERFKINDKKTRLLSRKQRQEVTGVTVNTKVNVTRKYTKQIRTIIHNWEKSGYDSAYTIFMDKYGIINTNSGHIPKLENVVEGKLRYMGMVKGFNDSTYLKLLSRFKSQMAQHSLMNIIDNSEPGKLKTILTNKGPNKPIKDKNFQRIQSLLNQLDKSDLNEILKGYGKE